MKRLGQKICVAVVLSLAFVAIWHDSAQAAMPVMSSIGQIKDSSVVNPTRIDVDAAGTIYLCDGTLNGVTRYNKYGKALPTLKGPYLVRPNGVAVTPDGSRVFVSVGEPGKYTPTGVAVINGSTGELLGYLGNGLNEFKRVVEIDLDGEGNIYVGNFDKAKTTTNLVNTAQVDVYSGSTYAKLYSFGKPASSLVSGYYRPLAGEFGEIAGLTVDVVNQEVLVAEGWNNDGISRVQIFGLDGTFKRLRPEASIAGTQINCKPIGLSVDPSGRVYMLSVLTSTVHVFTAHPEAYLGKFTSGTPDPAYDANGNVYLWKVGMIPTPSFDTVFDPLTGRLFVVTDGNGIQIFSVDGSTNPVKINSAPTVPAMLAPVQESKVATLTPTLQWSAALDADNDVLSYNVRIMAVDGALVSSANNVAATNLSVSTGTLLENNKYGWQVQSADAELTSAYSGVESFWVNAVEEAPTAPLLVSPVTATIVDKDTIFSWQAATDADPFATVTYRLEIAGSADFATPLITVEQGGLNSPALSTLPGYADLPAGTSYWRVVAVDNSGLTTASEVRTFSSVNTVLSVDATFPGAKVYLGGNGAYSGRYVGEVPVEVRGLNPGTIEVVVERAGFEPWVKSVVVSAGQSVAINAALVVAIRPDGFKKASLLAGGAKIQGGAEAAPVLVDFDNDGLDDLLVADGSGKLLYYQGIAGAEWPLMSGVQLANVTLPAGAVPFVADWNNDDRKDLLVGAADGSVSLYLNIGTQTAPVFAAPVSLQADNAPLSVGSNAAPLLFDLNADGAKDLLVGSGNGTLYKFLNIGSDAAPLFAAREVLIDAAEGAANASALVADWDADGSKEILLAANQDIAIYKRQADGSYAKGASLLVHQSLSSTTTRTDEMQSSSFGQKIRMVAANMDGIRGKDLLLGNAAGEILLANSTTNKVSAISPLFDTALLETVTEIEALLQSNVLSTQLLASTLSQAKKSIQAQAVTKMKDYAKIKENLVSLQTALQADAEISALLTKLQTQLNSTIPLN
jgi:sugar lactone lactonase YvrE